MSNFIEEKVCSLINGCPEGTVFLAAVSGGADSMAMLASLCAVVPKERIFCLHVEHGLRPAEESRGDAEFVRDYCEKAGVTCQIVSITPGKIAAFAKKRGTGIEAAARFFRRKALFRRASQLGEDARILIAHTKDDMLETALMRVLRGAGPTGLSAMPVKKGRLLRPLLNISRAQVIEYLKEKKVPWREDSTNTDEKFLRNRIRRKLVPLLDESFPSWKSALTGMADTQSLAAAFLAEEAKQRVTWEQSSNTLTTNAETFFTCPQIIREEALFRGLNFYSKKISHKGTKARRTQRKLNGSEALTLNSSSVPFVSPCLCVNSSFDFHPAKRSTIRRFCNGAAASIDLGALYITQKDGKIIISPAHKGYSEKGFSLLIKEPGLYNLNNISVKVLQRQDTDKGFFACLPLVLRRSFKDDFLVCKGRKVKKRDLSAVRLISAVDAFGTAAFIEKQEVLFGRDLPVNDKEFYLVEIGGIDV